MNNKEQGFINLNQKIIDGCVAGDQKAQFQLYKQYYLSMYNTSLRIVRSEAEAEDIMQDSFLSAFEKIQTYEGKVSFGAWLKRIVVNKSLDALRKKKVELIELQNHEVEQEEAIDENERTYQIEEIKNSLELLPDGYRVVLSLYLFEGYDHQEIAGILGISDSTSRSQYTRAKLRLLEIVKK